MTDKPEAGASKEVDPTKNVLDLVAITITRQDDLRDAGQKLLAESIAALAKWIETRFDAAQRERDIIEARRIEQKSDTQTAINAALASAKELGREQATAFAEQTRQTAATTAETLKGVTDLLALVKERTDRLETMQQGRVDNRSNSRLDVGMVVSVLALIVSVTAAILVAVR